MQQLPIVERYSLFCAATSFQLCQARTGLRESRGKYWSVLSRLWCRTAINS